MLRGLIKPWSWTKPDPEPTTCPRRTLTGHAQNSNINKGCQPILEQAETVSFAGVFEHQGLPCPWDSDADHFLRHLFSPAPFRRNHTQEGAHSNADRRASSTPGNWQHSSMEACGLEGAVDRLKLPKLPKLPRGLGLKGLKHTAGTFAKTRAPSLTARTLEPSGLRRLMLESPTLHLAGTVPEQSASKVSWGMRNAKPQDAKLQVEGVGSQFCVRPTVTWQDQPVTLRAGTVDC